MGGRRIYMEEEKRDDGREVGIATVKKWEKKKIQEIFKGNKIVQLLGDKKFILLIPPTKQHMYIPIWSKDVVYTKL